MRIHYLQHVPFENPGSIITWAKEREYSITASFLFDKCNLPNQNEFDWLIIMGGPMNIYEEELYPWLALEKQFIKETIENKKVVIGLCLGAQLIADVTGGKVTKNPHTEIGWFPVLLTDKIRRNPLFSFFPKDPVVFEWHGDTFSQLPDEAEVIAGNEACKNQAFIYKDRVFGFQFHLENTREIINALIENCSEEIIPGRYVQTIEELNAHTEDMELDNEWMNVFLTELEKVSDYIT